WKILPKTLPLSYWQGTVAASYMFTGERILPVPVVTDSQLGILQKDKDYTVSYGENYSVATGGKVYVTGIGNYKNQTSVSFEISKAPQTAFFTSPKYNNSNVGLEALRPDAAEFEVAFLAGAGYTGNYIIVYGYTDAIHPDQYKGETDPSRYTAKRMRFELSSAVDIEYISDDIVEIGGKYYSQTTARLYLSRDTFTPNATVQYGITTITLRANENINYDHTAIYPTAVRIIDDGYEQDLGQDASPLTHRLFIKKNHTAGGSFLSDITVTYGDPVFDITAGLNSGLTDYEIESSDDNILTIAEAPGNPLVRIATIHNAGEVTLTLIHKGVSDLDMPANSYNAVTARITVRVNKAVLTVSPNRQTVIYGTQPVYTAQSFTYLGFKYNDDISIIKSVNSGYNPQTMKDVGTYYLTASGVELNTEYINYEFEYPAEAGILEITRKTLYAYIEDARKVYGEENPALAISYRGFIDGESEHNAANFVAPEIDFNGVDRLTPVGTYQIRLRDGSARNYTIDVSGTANLEIRPAKVTIILENRTEEYNARSVYSYEPSILGIPGGTVPSGYATVSYYNGQDYTQVAPVNVGEYKVKVEYTAAAGDNYEGTVEYFDNVITILPIAPGIELESAVRTYNNVAYGEVPFKTALLPGVSGGSAPTGTLSFLYSRDGGEFTEALPRISGNYTVRVTYTLAEGATDNYIDGYYYDFADAVIIEKAEVTI
ncbi:MAG TPA: MBG domain-containing protein, partial [Clostridia bacterium]|nr:MBG domain-containing protein [Clostridia bacterium]